MNYHLTALTGDDTSGGTFDLPTLGWARSRNLAGEELQAESVVAPGAFVEAWLVAHASEVNEAAGFEAVLVRGPQLCGGLHLFAARAAISAWVRICSDERYLAAAREGLRGELDTLLREEEGVYGSDASLTIEALISAVSRDSFGRAE